MLDQIEAFFSLADRFKRFLATRKEEPEAETLAGRFFRLFEAHGVHRNQIPRFFGHGLQLRDVQDEVALMQCLTDGHLADACQLFGVEWQWLERGEGDAHIRHHFYLQPVAFGQFLDSVLARQVLPDVEVKATLFGVLERHGQVESTLLVSEPIAWLNDEVIYRFHYVDAGPLGYWKARVSTAALVAQAIRRKVWVGGCQCDAGPLNDLIHGKDLSGAQEHGQLLTGSRRFEVDDWLLEPDALLEGVDPERNRFGTTSALELWLTLDAEGLMKHPFAKPNTRDKFQVALKTEKAV